MFDRFTDHAKRVMSFARREALSFNHEYIGTEHILLGLIQEHRGVAANVLKYRNVDLEQIRREVEKLVKIGPSMVTMGQLPFTPRAKKVLELAMEEASEFGHNYIGTEHLLLGLIRERDGIAAQVLTKLGVKLEDAREEVLEFLGAPDEDRTDVVREIQVERFSDHAKRVMSLARQAAAQFDHEYIGTEHILLGLLEDGSDIAVRVLERRHVDAGTVRREVEKIVKAGPSMVTMGQLPFTPRAENVLELSMDEASELGHDYVGTEHLLLGLIKENEGIAAHVLMNLGVRLEDAREEVLVILGESVGDTRTLTVAEARALDRDATERLGMPSILLMENAARGVAETARTLGDRFVILCGPGNNGGDGLAAARHLGRAARVHLLAEPDPVRAPDAALQLRILRNAGYPIATEPPASAGEGEVWIDALFGTGLTRALDGEAARWVQMFNQARATKLCVDIPSGLHGDTGEPLGGIACRGDVTVTFHLPKRGLVQPGARAFTGRIVVAPLGMPDAQAPSNQ